MHSDPVAVFRAAVAALNREDWAGAAALCDPASLADFRHQLVGQFAPVPPGHEITAELYLRHEPGMPRAVAEYQAAQSRAHADPSRRLQRELAGHAPRRQFERQAAEGRASPGAVARALTHLASSYDYVPLGAVADGEGLSHVVYRQDRGGPPAGPGLADRPDAEEALARDLAWRVPPQIATCRRQPDGGWALVATHHFLGVANSYFEAVDPPAPEGAS
jgi:hypothetical protein